MIFWLQITEGTAVMDQVSNYEEELTDLDQNLMEQDTSKVSCACDQGCISITTTLSIDLLSILGHGYKQKI